MDPRDMLGRIMKALVDGDTGMTKLINDCTVAPIGSRTFLLAPKGASVKEIDGLLKAVDAQDNIEVVWKHSVKPSEDLRKDLEKVCEDINKISYVDGLAGLEGIGLILSFEHVPSSDEMLRIKDLLAGLSGHGEYLRIFMLFNERILDIVEVCGESVKRDIADTASTAEAISSAKPNREKVIQRDEILDLRISLETSQDVNDFINSL
jgi:hypothetical protein